MKAIARQAWRDAERRLGMAAQFVKKGTPVRDLETGLLTTQDVTLDVIAVPRRLTHAELAQAAGTLPQPTKGWSVRADQLVSGGAVLDIVPQDIMTCGGQRYEVLQADKDGFGVRWRLMTRVMHG